MTPRTLLRQPSGFLPLALSGAAFALLVGYVALFGVVGQPDGDEGAPARVFQLLMAAQLLVIMVFAATWIPRAPKAALLVLLLQLGAAVVPIATVIVLES
jgi:hypothetical protein